MGKVGRLLAILVFMLLWSCSDGAGSGLAPETGKPQESLTDSTGSFNVSSPGAVYNAITGHAVSEMLLERTGSAFEIGLAHLAAVEDSGARFSPDWTPGDDGSKDLAFAIYRFNLDGYTGIQTLKFTWGEAPVDSANLWIGLSCWGHNCWSWLAGPAGNLLELDDPGFTPFILDETGDLFIAVAMTGTDTALLDTITVGETAENDWWCFGHDRQHTRQSGFNGPHEANLRWAFDPEHSFPSSPAIGIDGTVYAWSCDYKLYAINPDGSMRWVCDTGGWYTNESSPAVAPDGTVYIGTGVPEKRLNAINPDGTFKWTFPVGMSIWSSPMIGPDGTVYVGSMDNNLYAINPDGTLKWSYATDDYVVSSPAISTDGIVYVGSMDGKLYALNPDGILFWAYTTDFDVQSSPAIGADGTVYVGSMDGHLYAINPDGTLLWSYQLGSVTSSPAISSDGTIFVGNDYDEFFAINADGTLRWSYTTGDPVHSSPAVGADGIVYVGCDNNYVYAFNPDGTLLWSYTTEYEVRSSPAIGADGTLYIGSDRLYAIQDAPEL